MTDDASETAASLHIHGDDLDPDEISRLLGLWVGAWLEEGRGLHQTKWCFLPRLDRQLDEEGSSSDTG